MMPIDTSDNALLWEKEKEAWNIFRALQGNPTCDVVRETFSGAVESYGIAGTLSDTGIAAVACTWSDLSFDEKRNRGLQIGAAYRRFVVWDLTGGFVVALTDKIKYPATTGQVFDITSVETLPSGQVEIVTNLLRGA